MATRRIAVPSANPPARNPPRCFRKGFRHGHSPPIFKCCRKPFCVYGLQAVVSSRCARKTTRRKPGPRRPIRRPITNRCRFRACPSVHSAAAPQPNPVGRASRPAAGFQTGLSRRGRRLQAWTLAPPAARKVVQRATRSRSWLGYWLCRTLPSRDRQGAVGLPLLKIRDRLGCPSADTPACPEIFIIFTLLRVGAPAWLRAVPDSQALLVEDVGQMTLDRSLAVVLLRLLTTAIKRPIPVLDQSGGTSRTAGKPATRATCDAEPQDQPEHHPAAAASPHRRAHLPPQPQAAPCTRAARIT